MIWREVSSRYFNSNYHSAQSLVVDVKPSVISKEMRNAPRQWVVDGISDGQVNHKLNLSFAKLRIDGNYMGLEMRNTCSRYGSSFFGALQHNNQQRNSTDMRYDKRLIAAAKLSISGFIDHRCLGRAI